MKEAITGQWNKKARNLSYGSTTLNSSDYLCFSNSCLSGSGAKVQDRRFLRKPGIFGIIITRDSFGNKRADFQRHYRLLVCLYSFWHQETLARPDICFLITWLPRKRKQSQSWPGTACKNMRFKRGSYRTGRDTSSFLVWITLGLSWVLPLVLGLDAWVFSLHLQTCCWSWIPVYSWEVAQQPIALRSSLHSTANRVVSFPKAVIKCIVQKQGVTIYDSCVCWLIFDFHLLIALAFFVQIL